jgi:hypothetical protein
MKKQIAYVKKNGSCIFIAKCKLADEQEIKQLEDEVCAYEMREEEEKKKILDRIVSLELTIAELKKEIKELKGEE